ncbi:MAG: FkbM family methyltransferase [Oscillibacter sp.]|jgi:FkbM family methyltransferase|nr:FkbM family methyltransferase [Oscillibacter sp.]
MGNETGMYGFIERARECYQLLQDELSRNIFEARLVLDYNPSSENIARIVALSEQQKWMDVVEENIPTIIHTIEEKPRKLVLYGTNVTGRAIASRFIEKGLGFYGFCGRRAKEFPDGLMGKPVLLPEYLFQYPDDFYVVVSACESADEIAAILNDHHFPQEQILFNFKPASMVDHQYFDFPALFRRGTAFVDGGCLNCRTSYLFADWCGGEYSKIFAFEPDPVSVSICEKNLSIRNIRDFHLIQAGLSNQIGKAVFRTGLYNCSHIVKEDSTGENLLSLPLTTVDHTVGKERIGFIKMDIEGAEFDALHGAKGVIVRDKPLLAISAYHRTGDMLAIMDYLHDLVPEYRFWLRHYSIGTADTVLYAAMD